MFVFSRVSLLVRRTVPQRMTIAVGVKQVVDHAIKVRVKDNKPQVATAKKSVNPFDEIALEEAVRFKERGIAKELVAINVGPAKSVDVLRHALAMGCDKAVHVVTDDSPDNALDSLAVARIFAALHAELKPDLWFLGKQAIDGDLGCTPGLLAGMLNVPLASFASKVEMEGATALRVSREVDAGHQVVEVPLPCVVSVDLRLNTPRFLKLPSIMKARKKPVDTRFLSSLKMEFASSYNITEFMEPVTKKQAVRVSSVEELLEKLRSIKAIP
eukprot:gene3713-2613_t